MKNLSNSNMKLRGDISHRLLMNYARLESKHYRPDNIFTADKNGWSGDWEGRTMLALIELSKITNKEPSYLEAIMNNIDHYINEKGYFGPILPEGVFDEQQFSGHNWFLRALIEYYSWKKDEKTYSRIMKVLDNLFLPAIGHYKDYPVNPSDRVLAGSYDGTILDKKNKWHTSSDVGCAFMCLDGLSKDYDLFHNEKVRTLIDEMIDLFKDIDFLSLSMQTHATLSATRGILSMYNTTKDSKYLDIAVKIVDIYIKHGMTENYANQNWFSRPTWTEPCAIVDSLMCAVELFYATKELNYLELAHKIYYNAISHAQRPNGGFGCDVCSGYETEFIKHHGKDAKGVCEAYWCCTMRGSEGLSYWAMNSVAEDDDGICFLNYNDAEFDYNGVTITEKTKYPKTGITDFKITNSGAKAFTMSFYIPSYADHAVADINGVKEILKPVGGFIKVHITSKIQAVTLEFNIPFIKKIDLNEKALKNHVLFSHGFLILGIHTPSSITLDKNAKFELIDHARYRLKGTDYIFAPINDVLDMEEQDVINESRQILFSSQV